MHPLSSHPVPLSLDERLGDLFADAPLGVSPGEKVQIESEQRLSALQRDIEARLEANRRLAEGSFVPMVPSAGMLPAAAGLGSEPLSKEHEDGGTPGTVSGENGRLSDRQTELEKQRALTAFLEQAVLSW